MRRPRARAGEFLSHPDYAVVAAAVRAISKHQWNAEGLIEQSFIKRALHEKGPQSEAARTAAAGALGLAAARLTPAFLFEPTAPG